MLARARFITPPQDFRGSFLATFRPEWISLRSRSVYLTGSLSAGSATSSRDSPSDVHDLVARSFLHSPLRPRVLFILFALYRPLVTAMHGVYVGMSRLGNSVRPTFAVHAAVAFDVEFTRRHYRRLSSTPNVGVPSRHSPLEKATCAYRVLRKHPD